MDAFPGDGIIYVELTVKTEENSLKFLFFTLHDEIGDMSIRDRSAFDGFVSRTDLSYSKQDIWLFWNKLGNGWYRENPMFRADNLSLHMLKRAPELYSAFGCRFAIEYDGAHSYADDWIFKNPDECDIPLFTNIEKPEDA